MAWVRFITDYENHSAGEVKDLPAVVARDLIHKGIAAGGRVFSHNAYEKAEVRYEKRLESKQGTETIVPNKLKPIDGTIKEIKEYLDSNGIYYPSQARKKELIDILENS